jgi:hypothetical protein
MRELTKYIPQCLVVKIENGSPVGDIKYWAGVLTWEEHIPEIVEPTDVELAQYGYVRVEYQNPPEYQNLKRVEQNGFGLLNNSHYQNLWLVRDATAEEAQAETDDAIEKVTEERLFLLRASDWTQLADVPLSAEKKAEWNTYRQALRDITAQAGYPFNVVFPTEPV